jgi:hypothetical protein
MSSLQQHIKSIDPLEQTAVAKRKLLCPSGNDPLVRAIMRPGRKRLAKLVVGAIVVGVLPFSWSIATGTFRNASLRIDAVHDYGYWNQFILFLPFMMWFIRYYFRGLEPAILTLRNRHVLSFSDQEFAEFASEANKIFAHPMATWLPYILAGILTFIGFFFFWGAHQHTWNSPLQHALRDPAVWFSMPSTFLLYLLLAGFVVRMTCIRRVIKLLLKDESRVLISALHPDGAGGLSPLGDFSMRVMPACLFGGFCACLAVLTNMYQYHRPVFYPLNVLYLAGYMAALTVAFFIPLMAAKDGMRKAKAASLALISNRCSEVIREAVEHLKQHHDAETLKVKSVENLTKLYEVANKMPIYPFDTQNVLRFASSVLWPLALMMLQWAHDKLTKP